MNKVMKLSEIKIKKSFLERPPHEEKLEECKKNYFTQDKPDRKIIVNHKGYLIDGYCLYLVMKELGVEETIVKISERTRRKKEVAAYRNQPTTYIFGIHPNAKERKEFCWRVPNIQMERFYGRVLPGDMVLCETRFGVAPVIVTRIETLDKCPVDMRVKKFVRKVETAKDVK